jgi:hypothetical protein
MGELGKDWLRGVVDRPESDAFPCDVFHGQVVGMFPWDGADNLIVKVMDEDVVKDECNGLAVVSYVRQPPCCACAHASSPAWRCVHCGAHPCSKYTAERGCFEVKPLPL